MTEYKHIGFSDTGFKGKTKRYWCVNRMHDNVIGVVEWYGPWRQYCFAPNTGTVFSAGCLADIQDFIERLHDERKVARKEKGR